MKRHLSVDDLARDERFERLKVEDLIFDPRNAVAFETTKRRGGFVPKNDDAPDAARQLMHGIFVGEIQALEGAGRTCYDVDTASAGKRRPGPAAISWSRTRISSICLTACPRA